MPATPPASPGEIDKTTTPREDRIRNRIDSSMRSLNGLARSGFDPASVTGRISDAIRDRNSLMIRVSSGESSR